MALFNKTITKPAELAVLDKMIHSELLDVMIYALKNDPQYAWVLNANPGENCERHVAVEQYWFLIEVPGADAAGDSAHSVKISFAKSGYEPLGKKPGISCSRMCFLYATAIQKRLEEILFDSKFSSVSNNRNREELGEETFLVALGTLLDEGARAEFTYRLPKPKSIRLF